MLTDTGEENQLEGRTLCSGLTSSLQARKHCMRCLKARAVASLALRSSSSGEGVSGLCSGFMFVVYGLGFRIQEEDRVERPEQGGEGATPCLEPPGVRKRCRRLCEGPCVAASQGATHGKDLT
jgi:hypothetical protein